jgi:iron complex outermembrane receptor protein
MSLLLRHPAILLCTIVLATTPTVSNAQDARIGGTVRSAAGTPLASARITVSNNLTRAVRTAVTDASGVYSVAGLTEGVYTVSASLFGYLRANRADVQVPGTATVDFTLQPIPLQAVTVTATLREQELTDVPFSIAAPTASMLRERGAENIEAIAANVAGFSVQNLGPGQSQVAMRGVSSGQIARDQPGVKEQVSTYLDDTPISLSLFTPDLDLFDLSRVEVLRGPQGTLFGAGSLSGTVRYITNQPELGVNSVFGETSAHWVGGGGPGATVKLGMNVPLAERVAGRLAVFHNRFGGYQDVVRPDLTIDENANDGQRMGVRAAVRFAPNDRFDIMPRLVFQKVEMAGWNRTDTFNILANPYTTSRPATSLGDRRLFLARDEPFSDDFVLGDLNLKYAFGGMTLTSITSYTWRDILVTRDGGALIASIFGGSIGFPEPIYTLENPFDDRTNVDMWTQEARLVGGTDRVKWLVGAFYSDAHRDYGQSVRVPGFEAATGTPTAGPSAARDEVFFSDLSYDFSQRALFGEGTLALGERLDLTAGLRWYDFDEDRDQVFDGFLVGFVSQPGSTTASGVAPRFMASFRASDNVTLNAQASQGFRLGGINDPLNVPICSPDDLETFGGRDSWEDETAWNYEVGAKTSWLSGRASLNVSAFHMDISDLQVTATAGTCSSRIVFNVPRAISQGAEVELALAPTPMVDLALSATLNDSELRSTLISTDAGGTETVVGGIQEGNRLPSVPKFQAAASATLRRPLRGGAVGFLTGSAQHIGSRYTLMEDLAPTAGTVDMEALPNTVGGPLTQRFFTFDPELPAYTIVNGRLGLTRANWETAFFINNLTDERAFLALDRERGTLARVGYLVNQPRTFGVSFGFSY